MSSLAGPPRYVPTLTEVVPPAFAPEANVSAAIAPADTPVDAQELMLQRVLQRVELILERRLHNAIEQLILEHTHALMPRLRKEIELVVRESVTQAFEQEPAPPPRRS